MGGASPDGYVVTSCTYVTALSRLPIMALTLLDTVEQSCM